MLGSDPSFVMVGEVDHTTVQELVRKESPDILVADARIDGTLALCTELRRNRTRPWVIVVDADAAPDWAARALEAGARGILAKNAPPEHLVKAIHVVHEGEIWAPKEVMARIVDDLAALSDLARTERTFLAQQLSRREQEIVRHVAAGLSNQEIADHCQISDATVKAHLTRIFQKIGVRDRAQLTARYYRSLYPEGPN